MNGVLNVALAGVLLVTGCTPGTSSGQNTDLVVFAAASLDRAFRQLGGEFETAHPGVRVRLSFGGSATLVDQLSGGAAVDVLATADRATMDKVATAGLVRGAPARFATNALTLVVPAGNPAAITGLDSSLDGRKLVVCAEAVPCGAATRRLAAALGVELAPVSEEASVTDVRTKVESGQADAGIVYTTEAAVSGDLVEVIGIEGADPVGTEYLIGVPTSARHAALGIRFAELVTGSRGQAVLAAAGFGSGRPR